MEKEFLKEFPCSDEVFQIALRLQEIQRKAFYGLYSSITQSGRYCHENTMYCGTWNKTLDCEASESQEDSLLDCFKDIARIIYSRLEAEYEYSYSEECFLDSGKEWNLFVNDYEELTCEEWG